MKAPTLLFLTCAPLVSVHLASCRMVPFGFGDAPESAPVDWGPSDVGELTREVLQPLFTSPELSSLSSATQGPDARILVLTCGLLNGTREPLDPALVMSSLRRAMLETGRFRFPAGVHSDQQLAQEIRARPGGASADDGRVAAAGARRWVPNWLSTPPSASPARAGTSSPWRRSRWPAPSACGPVPWIWTRSSCGASWRTARESFPGPRA